MLLGLTGPAIAQTSPWPGGPDSSQATPVGQTPSPAPLYTQLAQVPSPAPHSAPPTALPPQPGETLEAAWQVALSNDQKLQASHSNLAAAQSSLSAATAERYPSASLGANYIALTESPHFSLGVAGLPPLEASIFPQSSAGAHGLVNQPLYTSGRITSGISAAEAGLAASQATVERTRLDVKLGVAEAYVGVLRAQRLVEVAESRAASLAAHNRDVASYFERGRVNKSDLLASQVALADARQQALQVRNALEIARAAYNRALGRPLADPVQLADLHDVPGVDDVEQLTLAAVQTRPELAELAAQARSLREQAATARAKGGPQLGVMGGYLYQRNPYLQPNGEGVLAVTAEWNALDMGRSRHQSDALCQKADAMARTCRDAESLVALEVRQKWLDLQTARQRLEVARQAVAQADENLRVAGDRYQNQVGTNTEVLDAETLRVGAYSNFYNSTYEAVIAGLRLRRAVGDL